MPPLALDRRFRGGDAEKSNLRPIELGIGAGQQLRSADRCNVGMRHPGLFDTVPPGEEEMKRLRKKIRYSYEERPNGGRVVIFSTDKKAQSAIHRFLRFQIEEHKTGDPEEVR